MREVNRKITLIAVVLMAVAMLATPMVGIVQAGKGQEKLYFKLYMEGGVTGTPDRSWEAGVTMHSRGGRWEVLGDFYVLIGVETIEKEYLSYDQSQDSNTNLNTDPMFSIVKVREIISIYDSDTIHDETTLRGTLEILVTDKVYYTWPLVGEGTFVGHGTGEFEGVKVAGTDSGDYIEKYPGVWMLAVTREGTVMGWPT